MNGVNSGAGAPRSEAAEGEEQGPRALREFQGDEEACVYLPEQRARMRYRYIEGCPAPLYQKMLEAGWRRFGRMFFRPACALCQECRSLRVEVADFRPSRSMRRNLRENRDLEVRISRPAMSSEHLALYRRYHRDMAQRRGWEDRGIDPLDYYRTFIEGYEDFGYELQVRLQRRLVAVALFDQVPDGLSAVYCFYDPRRRDRGLGVYAILQQIERARRLDLPWVYLGYFVAGNRSMAYKARYRPHEILDERRDGGILRWRPGQELLSGD